MLTQLSTEDRLIGLSMLMTLAGIILGAIFANPDFIGITAILVIVLLLIGWWLTVVQFGYLALRLNERRPNWAAVGAVTLLGMALPPWYEEFAVPAKAWYYPPSGVMLSNTPLWVILTYGGCMFGIATMALINYRPQAWGRAVIAGLFTGGIFMLAGVFWYTLLG